MRLRLSRSSDSPLRRWRQLILGLLGGLLAIQAVTLVLFAVSSWHSNRSQSQAFADQAVTSASVAAATQIQELVRDFESSVNLTVQSVNSGVVPGGLDARTERFLLEQLRTHPALEAIYLGFGTGEFLMVSRDASKGHTYRVKRVRTVGGRRVIVRWLDANLVIAATESLADDTYDPRERPWFQAATDRRGVIWTDPYIFFSSRRPGLTVARQAADTGRTVRVVGADFGVDRLGDFARDIRVGSNGATIIVAGDGSVIAAPDLKARITEGADGKLVLPRPDAFPAPVPAVGAAIAAARPGQTARVQVGAGPDRTAAAITRVPVGQGTWSVALYGPASDFASGADRSGRRHLIKIILLGVAALCLAVLLAAALTRPLGGLASSAASDGLTGLANRREIESAGAMLFERSQAGARMLSVGIVDVDRFKQINDTHGHLAGDDTLRAIAEALSASVRRDDVVGRFAGDEFVIVMPDAGGPEAHAVADRALRAIRELHLPAPVTASAGVATLTREVESFAELLDAADRALYRAKAAGRDRVARDGDHPPPVD